jgi:hypothetical protein
VRGGSGMQYHVMHSSRFDSTFILLWHHQYSSDQIAVKKVAPSWKRWHPVQKITAVPSAE